jgi:hypothetical protein
MGFMLGPASTDAVNRASRLSYGEATGITQTVRNYAASLGLAILGTVLITQMRSKVTTSLISRGVPAGRAGTEASGVSQSHSGSVSSIPHFIRLDFAYATQTVLYVMAVIMAVAAVVALLGLRQGVQEDTAAAGAVPGSRPEPDHAGTGAPTYGTDSAPMLGPDGPVPGTDGHRPGTDSPVPGPEAPRQA